MLSPQQIVDAQIEAYKRGDASAFASLYDEDAVCSYHPSRQVLARGRAEIERVWGEFFDRGEISFTLVNRITFDRFVVDHEEVSVAGGSTIHAVAIYLVGDELISRVWFLDGAGG